jgi:hypothetical protein
MKINCHPQHSAIYVEQLVTGLTYVQNDRQIDPEKQLQTDRRFVRLYEGLTLVRRTDKLRLKLSTTCTALRLLVPVHTQM